MQKNSKKIEPTCIVANDLTKECGIVGYIVKITNAVVAAVAVIIVIMITIGGIQYSTAGGDPGAVAAARKRITDAVIALVIFIFMYAFLQWIVPGGIV